MLAGERGFSDTGIELDFSNRTTSLSTRLAAAFARSFNRLFEILLKPIQSNLPVLYLQSTHLHPGLRAHIRQCIARAWHQAILEVVARNSSTQSLLINNGGRSGSGK